MIEHVGRSAAGERCVFRALWGYVMQLDGVVFESMILKVFHFNVCERYIEVTDLALSIH